MPIDNTRQVRISRAQQGGFSAVTLPAAVPYMPAPPAIPFDMGWVYIQQVMRTGSTIFGRPEDYYRITAFTADGSASAQITENSTAHNQIEENWVIPVRPGVFVFAHGFFDVMGGTSEDDFFVVGNQALLIEAASVSAITLSSSTARSLIYDKYWDALYPDDEYVQRCVHGGWQQMQRRENGIFGFQQVNGREIIRQRCGDGSFFQASGYTAALRRRRSGCQRRHRFMHSGTAPAGI
jgi:hypothetical protein